MALAKIIMVFLLSYLLGSIPSGVWVGKFFFHKDIRQFGSGNSGATNAFRVLGKKAGLVVALVDVLKGTLAASLPLLLNVPVSTVLVGLAAIIGHIFPLFAGFRGGKAVATSAGVALAYNPLFLLGALVVFLILLFLTSIVSLTSISTVLIASIAVIWVDDWFFRVFVWTVTLIVILRHISNLKRILNGTENRVPFGLGKKRSE